MVLLVLLLVSVAAGGLTGCGQVGAQSAPSSPPSNPPPQGVWVNPGTVAFNNVSVGKNSTQNVTVTNSTAAGVSLTQATLAGTSFSLSGLAVPATLAPGASSTFSLTFSPAGVGTVTGTLKLTDSANTTPLSVTLSGTGMAPQIATTSSSLTLGNVTVGTNATQSFAISNFGNDTLHVSQIAASGTGFTVSSKPSLPLSLDANQAATVTIQFAPQSAGAASGNVTITSDASNGTSKTVSLSATGTATATPHLGINPTSVSFGSVTTGTSSSQTITISNSGSGTLNVTQQSVTGAGFSVTGLNLPLALSAGQNSTFNVVFAPASAGSVTGSLSLTSNDLSTPTASIALAGTGLAPATPSITLNPASLSFGSVTVGSNSTLNFTITNSGSATLNVSQISIAGTGFTLSMVPTLPLALAANQSATATVRFAPLTATAASGTVTVSSDASNGTTKTVTLSGTGLAPATPSITLNPASLSFGSVTVGSNSTLNFTITNSGSATLNVSQISIAGTGFTLSAVPTLPLALAANQSATATVRFAPLTATAASGTVTVSSDASNGTTKTVTLSGTGATALTPQLTLTPGSASFGNVVTGSNSSQPIKITNSGNATLTISQQTVAGTGFSVTGLTVPLSLTAGQNTTFNLVFAPQSSGNVSGSLTLASNDPSSPNTTIALSGTGVAATFTLSANPTSLSFGNVNVGSSSQNSVTLSNSGNSSITISQFIVSGAGFSANGVATPVTLSPAQTATLNVTFAPTGAGNLTGTVNVSSNATSTPSISLSGSGVQPVSHSATLTWNASTSAVTGYNVYRASTSGGPYAKLNSSLVISLTYTDSTVLAGQTYFYVVTALDSSNTESDFSNQASGQIPTP
jgi:uncharacterized membrane protein